MIATKLRNETVNRTMKAITPTEHQRNNEYFQRILGKMQENEFSEKLNKEIEELDTLYNDYLWHISKLRNLLTKYQMKITELKDLSRQYKTK